jgi:outer membrane biosynthesis protein TonB
MGVVELLAKKIDTTTDAKGRETYIGSGGAVLIKESTPPIFARAERIEVRPDSVVVKGPATVKKRDLLTLTETEDSIIRIDGVSILPEGAFVTRRAGLQESASEAKPAPVVVEAAPEPKIEATKPVDPPAAAPKPKPAPVKKQVAAQPAPKPKATTPAATPPAPKPAPDRSAILQLMREPSDL